jgi:hypothetical protein
VHIEAEVQAEQFVGQTKQDPFDKYLPIVHVEHNKSVEELHVKQLYVVSQHSELVDRE